MPVTPVQDIGEALLASLAAALAMFLGAIPKVIGFLVILIIGWIVASALAGAVASLLRAVRFNELAQRSGIADFVRNMGAHTDASGVIATIAKWFVRLIVLVVAFDALGLPAVSEVLQQLLLWLPNLVVALFVLVIAGLAAQALGNLVRGATAQAGLGNPDLMATIARAAVMGFAIVVAVNQIGIARELVNTLFMGVVGALALAIGLAFGLGGRETAGQMVHSWYARSRRAAPRVGEAAGVAQQEARGQVQRAQAEVSPSADTTRTSEGAVATPHTHPVE
jgi:hypothetical protein